MAAIDRVRSIVRGDNVVRQGADDRSRSAQDLHGASPPTPSAPPSVPASDGLPSRAGAASAAYKAEPDAIARAYYVEERGQERRYYDDYLRKSLAIRTTDTTITSKREDLTTVRAIVDLAEARGWRRLEIQGSETFRREAWIEAAARGIDARGYRATDPDRQEADRRALNRPERSERPASPDKLRAADRPAGPHAPTTAETAAPAAPPSDREPAMAEHRRRLRSASSELSADGRLVLAALSEKIDRQMARQTADVKVELKAFAARELVARERRDGPVVLSEAQRRAASAPAPDHPGLRHAGNREPQSPHRSLAR